MTSTFVRQTRLLPSSVGWIKLLLIGIVLFAFIREANCTTEPTESECRPYIDKALKEQHLEKIEVNKEPNQSVENSEDLNEKIKKNDDGSLDNNEDGDEDVAVENEDDHDNEKRIINEEADDEEEDGENDKSIEVENETVSVENENATDNDDNDGENDGDDESKENKQSSGKNTEKFETPEENNHNEAINTQDNSEREDLEGNKANEDEIEKENDDELEHPIEIEMQEIKLDADDDDDDEDDNDDDDRENDDGINADGDNPDDSLEKDANETVEHPQKKLEYKATEEEEPRKKEEENLNDERKTAESEEIKVKPEIQATGEVNLKVETEDRDRKEKESNKIILPTASTRDDDGKIMKNETLLERTVKIEVSDIESAQDKHEEGSVPEEELTQKVVIPQNLRPRDHIYKILKLDERDSSSEKIFEKTTDTTLKSLKSLYDNAIKPLEMLYKYRDLSNRHFGDPEIFSKPLILFMGPWSGGKSSTINYLLDNEFAHTSLRTGAEPSPAYFNILMYGEEEEILDGTQLAADWTFSGLQKFGQSLLDRLKGVKLPHKLLKKVNIVEIPGILEIRKQVQRLFPFNDACQWFIDRADIIFLVYDPSKLDVGPETEAILDQLKGRESQTRIILNKADQVKPEELMRVQGTLIWNISPLMSSSEPPVMYSTSLWSMPFETGAPTRLLMAQERAFLKDLREAIDKRVENKISSARRFAVRVRNHAKMVDCYLTTYYNHKSFFGNRKRISDDIIEHPQKYHIYEGLSTLTNISRYDLPDPDVYQDFFKINPLYEFKKLSETCTYFRGCPINKLDIVIAYDLPELIGKYRKAVETAKEQLQKENS